MRTEDVFYALISFFFVRMCEEFVAIVNIHSICVVLLCPYFPRPA